jgi:hypothetical protein
MIDGEEIRVEYMPYADLAWDDIGDTVEGLNDEGPYILSFDPFGNERLYARIDDTAYEGLASYMVLAPESLISEEELLFYRLKYA